MNQFRITAPAARHFGAWRELFFGYAKFYQTECPPAAADAVWEWICAGKLRAILGEDDAGALCAFAHWEKILRPLRAQPLAYLHDLYVRPEARGCGAASALIAEVSAAAKVEGCAAVRWATAADNETAMRLYDRVARKTSWVIYERNSG
ncbi:MAG: GNAT family N-acetyltransferase [Gammaproteobacteria bacterium]